MDAPADLAAGDSPTQRRAVLAERLLLDLGEANSRTEAAMLLAQALRAIGGADGVRILRLDPDHGGRGPALLLAESGIVTEQDASTLTDRASGLELTVSGVEVPPVAVTRSLRALATVLDRIAEQERLLTEARTDPLTGLLNRRALDERLEAELARQERAGGPVSLVLLDIDHFKGINDQHGHARGDEVLQGVADAMRDVARTADVLGRIGGDEFALLLADTGEGGAWVASNRLRDRIRRLGVTASLGAVTAVETNAWTVSDLLRAADEALYEAKRAGRDRAVTTWGTVGA